MPLPTRTVTFENGETRDNVPIDIRTFEEYEEYMNSPNRLPPTVFEDRVEPKKPEEYGGFGRDVKRVYRSTVGQASDFLEAVVPANAALNINKTAEDLYGDDFYDLSIGERMERVRTARAKAADDSAIGSLVNPTTEELSTIVDRDGYATRTETTGGAILNLSSYVAGGIGILNGLRRLATSSPRAFRELTRKYKISADTAAGIATGVATDQWITNPNEGSIISSLFPDIPDSALLGIGEYLQAPEEDDSDAEKRLKMLIGNLPLEIVLGGLGGIISGSLGKNIDELSKEEIVDKAVEGLKRTKAETPTGTTTLSSSKVVDDATEQAQVFNQEGTIKGLWQKFTQSRGFNTYAGQDAFEQSQQAARKYRNRSQHISGRLQQAINNAVKNTDDTNTIDRVYDALTSTSEANKNAFKNLEGEELTNYLTSNFKLNTEVAESVVEARNLVDELSLELRQFAPNKKIKDTIDNNLNNYLRRSYRQFEDKEFIPTAQVIAKAEQHMLKILQENEMFRLDEALKKGKTYKVKTNLDDRAASIVRSIMAQKKFDVVKGIQSKIFKQRKDIGQPIRELLGEVKSPEDALIISVDKMSKFYERARFLDDMNKIGNKQGWLFKDIPEGMDGLVQLKNTGSKKLDGKWTTENMEKVIMEKEISMFGDPDVANSFYKNFLSVKSFANRAATVFNWTTHMRNFLGGVQFGLANGLNPFSLGVMSEKSAINNLRVLGQEAKLSGDKALNELHEKYLNLGIINTNVRVGDFRALINEGIDATSVDNFMAGYSNKVSRAAEKLYIGTDDLFKINSFNTELNWLKRAYKNSNRSLESLELEAADIVKNTMPNYDRVPPGIKALRNLPIGSFVSFPAEILRTTYNIFRQTAKEIGSGNKVLAARGVMRGTGLSATAIGFDAAGEITASSLGWSDDQRKAATVLSETPWSGSENVRLWRQDEDTGKIYVTDTKYLDAYNTVKEPIISAYRELQKGRMEDKDVIETGFNMIVEGAKPLLTPFVSEEIFTKTVTDIYFAVNNPNGRTPDGKVLFSPNATSLDKVGDVGYHLLDNLLPGTLESAERMILAADEERNPYTGKPLYDLGNEVKALATGVRWTEFDPEQQLNFKIIDYRNKMSSLTETEPNYRESFGTLTQQYKDRQRSRYEIQKELYRNLQASQYFRSDREILNQLQDLGISRDDSRELLKGRFIPEDINIPFLREIASEVGDTPKKGTIKEYDAIERELEKIYSDMSRTLLNTPDEED